LNVERPTTATPAERVRLVVALSETGGTLRWEAISLDVYGKAREYGVLIVNGRLNAEKVNIGACDKESG